MNKKLAQRIAVYGSLALVVACGGGDGGGDDGGSGGNGGSDSGSTISSANQDGLTQMGVSLADSVQGFGDFGDAAISQGTGGMSAQGNLTPQAVEDCPTSGSYDETVSGTTRGIVFNDCRGDSPFLNFYVNGSASVTEGVALPEGSGGPAVNGSRFHSPSELGGGSTLLYRLDNPDNSDSLAFGMSGRASEWHRDWNEQYVELDLGFDVEAVCEGRTERFGLTFSDTTLLAQDLGGPGEFTINGRVDFTDIEEIEGSFRIETVTALLYPGESAPYPDDGEIHIIADDGSRIEIVYDQSTITVTANGETRTYTHAEFEAEFREDEDPLETCEVVNAPAN